MPNRIAIARLPLLEEYIEVQLPDQQEVIGRVVRIDDTVGGKRFIIDRGTVSNTIAAEQILRIVPKEEACPGPTE